MFTSFRPSARLATSAAGAPGTRYAARPAGISSVALDGVAAPSAWRTSSGPSGPISSSAAEPASSVLRSRGRVVLAGGDAAQGLMIHRTLERDGFDVVPQASGRATVVSLIAEPADVLLVNAPLRDGSAAALVRWVRARPVSAAMTCMVICPSHDTTTVAGLYDAGADVVITRQTELDLLSRKVAAALARRPLAMAS